MTCVLFQCADESMITCDCISSVAASQMCPQCVVKDQNCGKKWSKTRGSAVQYLCSWNPLCWWCWSSSTSEPSSSLLHWGQVSRISEPSLLLNSLSLSITCSRTRCSSISESTSSLIVMASAIWGESKFAVEDCTTCWSCSSPTDDDSTIVSLWMGKVSGFSVSCTSSDTFPVVTNCGTPTWALLLCVTLAPLDKPPFKLASCPLSLKPHILVFLSVHTTTHLVIITDQNFSTGWRSLTACSQSGSIAKKSNLSSLLQSKIARTLPWIWPLHRTKFWDYFRLQICCYIDQVGNWVILRTLQWCYQWQRHLNCP